MYFQGKKPPPKFPFVDKNAAPGTQSLKTMATVQHYSSLSHSIFKRKGGFISPHTRGETILFYACFSLFFKLAANR